MRRLSAAVAAAVCSVVLVGCPEDPTLKHTNVSYLHVALDPADPFTTIESPDDLAARQALDIRLPDNVASPAPVVIAVPGGGWVAHDRDSRAMARLVADGFAVVAIDYRPARTSTGDHFAQLAYDVDRAIRWVRAHHDRLGIDPTRVIVSGHSAGAHLAAAVAVGDLPAPNDPTCTSSATCSPPLPPELAAQSSRPDGLLLLAGAYDLSDPDLAAHRPTWPRDSDGDGDIDEDDEPLVLDPDVGTPEFETTVENLLGCPPLESTCADRVAEASPSTDAHEPLLGAMPPTFIAHAVDDDTSRLQQSVAFAFRLCLAGATVHYEELPTGGHPVETLSNDKIDQFLSIWNPASAPDPSAPAGFICNP